MQFSENRMNFLNFCCSILVSFWKFRNFETNSGIFYQTVYKNVGVYTDPVRDGIFQTNSQEFFDMRDRIRDLPGSKSSQKTQSLQTTLSSILQRYISQFLNLTIAFAMSSLAECKAVRKMRGWRRMPMVVSALMNRLMKCVPSRGQCEGGINANGRECIDMDWFG